MKASPVHNDTTLRGRPTWAGCEVESCGSTPSPPASSVSTQPSSTRSCGGQMGAPPSESKGI